MNYSFNFSACNREANLQEMAAKQLDLLVIGGGITGAGIALDGVSRGLTVGLLEKQDFASGTSSRSTKLIHGGLRYLKQGEIQLVREVGRERAILHKNAPHIVIPEKMLLPIIKGGTYGKWATSVGLWMYDRLAGVKPEERRVMLDKKRTRELEPLLRDDILTGGGLYIEYRTDDARLTIEVMKTAAKLGASCSNYSEVTEFIYNGNRVSGVKATDLLTGKSYEIYAKKIVNATGPWVDGVRKKDASLYGKRLHLTKGVHLVLPHEKIPVGQSVYFDVPDGRMIFAIPRDGCTYVGTTDTNYEGELEEPSVTQEDVDYLLQAINNMFPDVNVTEEDIVSSWAGLRPLIHEDGKSPSELSRKDEIIVSPSGLLTIAGGKLTGFRKMAERIVDLVMTQLGQEEGRPYVPCCTEQIVLSGGEVGQGNLEGHIKKLVSVMANTGLQEAHIRTLFYRYGANTDKVLERFLQLSFSQAGDVELRLSIAELRYGIEEEMVTSVDDHILRRTSKALFHREGLQEQLPALTKELEAAFFIKP